MPSACTLALIKCRDLLIFNGTHCSSKYGGILLVVTIVDADESNLVLAQAIVPTESKDWWEWFLKVIVANLTTFGRDEDDPRKFAIITDRGKGLVPAITKYFPGSQYYYCTWYLGENVDDNYNNKIASKFKQICRVNLKREFQALLAEIRGLKPEAAKYIEDIDDGRFDRWAKAFAPYDFPRYGHTTSSVGESMNSRLLDKRKKPILYMMEGIQTYTMKLFYDRGQFEQKDENFIRFAVDYIADRRMMYITQKTGKPSH